MVIRSLLLITALGPVVGINLAYWIGVNADVLPSCFPYFDGCTSISSTGRYPPGDRLFRAIMLPQAALLAVTWYFAVLWLRSLRPDARSGNAVLFFGLMGAAALVLYVSYLGTKEPFYELMRRFGIYLYFIGTVFAQMILTLSLRRSPARTAMLWILAVPWVLGIVNFVQKSLRAEPDRMENAIEWIVSLLMQAWFLLLYLEWRNTKFRLSVKTG
ncbi:MAG: hypothetical protein KJN77_03405 [Gammaproteobacteria bacterium]|nr:hypothetical protein [Gammaproteobacteria bacterium]